MALKTKIDAEPGKHDLVITREFDLPVELLFKAHTDAAIVEEWMGTKVLEFNPKTHGSYRFETTNPQANITVRMHGVIHEFVPNEKITRTFEMENTPFSVQLEFQKFERLTDGTSKITIHTVFETGAHRDQMLKMPFTQGINMAHNRLEEIVSKLK
jgi:uncharacterized protein YndB with AHSA1/START domain